MPGDLPELSMLATLIAFCGGLALFLFGIDQLTGGLKSLAGDRLRGLLASLTGNRFIGALSGLLVTATIQSSSITTVLVVGFVSAGLLSVMQAIPVIIGASVGTTVTAQIIAFKITESALAWIAIGFAIQLVSKQPQWKHLGGSLLGLGLLFFGMNVMSDAVAPLREYPPAIETLRQLDSPLAGILVATVFTAIIQSSSATLALIIVLASQNLITLEQSVPLILGANIGTCATALLASIGKSRLAIQTALAHILFHLLGVALWYGFQGWVPPAVRWLSSDPARQVAHAQTLINTLQALLFIWWVTPLARLAAWIAPDRPAPSPAIAEAKYLDAILLDTPAAALQATRRELCRLGMAALQMVRRSLPTVIQGNQLELDRLESLDDDVDSLHAAIITYLGKLSQRSTLSQDQSDQLHDSLLIANYFENIGDMIESNLVSIGRRRVRLGLTISPETGQSLERLHRQVSWAVERTIRCLADDDLEVAHEVIGYKVEIQQLVAAAERRLANRLVADEPLRLTAFRLESEILEHLKRIYYFVKRIAHTLVGEQNPPADGAGGRQEGTSPPGSAASEPPAVAEQRP